MNGLGWSEPHYGWFDEPAPRCSQIPDVPALMPRQICAVSPQDDWIRSECGCLQTWVQDRNRPSTRRNEPCETTGGNAGTLHCCPTGCPSTASGGGVETVSPEVFQVKDDLMQRLRQGQQQREELLAPVSPVGVRRSTVPVIVIGGLGALAVAGLGFWLYRKNKKREALEDSLLYSMMEREEVS